MAPKPPAHSAELPIGSCVRYLGLGAGRVTQHVKREFRGEEWAFAEIVFPHHDLRVQVPLGDPKLQSKIFPVEKPGELKSLLALIGGDGAKQLARTWDERELAGRKKLRDGGPHEWACLLRDYAAAARGGMTVSSTDADVVRDAQALLAAELAAARAIEFDSALATVCSAYEKAASQRKTAVSAR